MNNSLWEPGQRLKLRLTISNRIRCIVSGVCTLHYCFRRGCHDKSVVFLFVASSETEEAQPEEVVAEVVPDGSILSAEAVREHNGSVRISGLRRSGEQTSCELTHFQWEHSSS